MDDPERFRHYPNEENVPLSEAIREAVEAHDDAEAIEDESALYEHVNVEAVDELFTDLDGVTKVEDVSVTLQLDLPNVQVSVWSDSAVDIRVTGDLQRKA